MTTATEAAAPNPAADRSAPSTPPAAERQTSVLLILERFGLVFVFVLMIVAFSILRPETFPTADNWQAILVSQSVVAVAALALVIPLTGGRFDVSVGANLGLCAIACAAVMSKSGGPLLLAVLVAVGFGTAIGFINGFIVAYLGVNSIIATLGTATIIGGFVQLYTEGVPISGGISTTLTDLSSKTVLGIPQLFVVALVVALAVWYLLTQTPFGRRLAAVGVNPTAAHLVGISVRRTVMLSFVSAGVLAGIAGVMAIGLQGSGSPETGGIDFILPALAAAFLGATVFHPGQYNIPGTLLGLLFVGTAVSGLALLGVEPWVEQVFNGSAVIVAVALSQYFRRQRTGATDIGG